MASAETEVEPPTVQVKKPPNAFWLFLEENRAAIEGEVGTKATTTVSKEASKKWKALSDAEREEFRKRFTEIKAGTQVQLTDSAKPAKLADTSKEAPDSTTEPAEVEQDPESARGGGNAHPKAPKTKRKQPEPRQLDCAFWLFLGQSKEDIIKTVGSDNPQSVAGVALEMWAALPAIECVRLKSWAVELQTAIAELPAASSMCANGTAGDGEEQDTSGPLDAKTKAAKRTSGSAAAPQTPKKPRNAPGVFGLFLQENRASIEVEIGSRSAAMVIKRASDKLAALSQEDRHSLELRAAAFLQQKSDAPAPASASAGDPGRSGGATPDQQASTKDSVVVDSEDEAPLASRRQSVKPEAKPAAKSEAKTEAKTEAKLDAKPEAKSKTKRVSQEQEKAKQAKRVKQPQATQAFKAAVLEAVRHYIEENAKSWSRSLMIDELSEKHGWEHDMYLDSAVKAAIKACGHEGLGAGVPKATTTV